MAIGKRPVPKFDQDMMNKLEEMEKTVGYLRPNTNFKTRVYVPVSFIDDEIVKHKKFVEERQLKVHADLSRDEMRERILDRINSLWTHTYQVKEYALYVNMVTGEKRKLV
jgi:hypothetical protein